MEVESLTRYDELGKIDGYMNEKAPAPQSARAQLLADASQAFAEAGLDYLEVLTTVVRRTAEVIGDVCVIHLLSNDEKQFQLAAFHHVHPASLEIARRVSQISPTNTDMPYRRRLLAGESLFLPSLSREQRAALEVEFPVYLAHPNAYGLVIVPLRAQGRVIGALGLARDTPGQPYSPDDKWLLQNLADRAALTIQNARLFQSLSAQHEHLQQLSARLVQAQEIERRHIARELHDEIGQVLTGLQLTLEVVGRHVNAAGRASVAQSQEQVSRLIEQVQNLSLDLRPSLLDELGLAPALQWHLERYTRQTGIHVKVRQAGLARRFTPEIETVAYRIVQEALTNAARHAAAPEVSVGLQADDTCLVIQIEDSGSGFDVAGALADRRSSGLSGMRERAALVDGHLVILSTPGVGTTITLTIPLA